MMKEPSATALIDIPEAISAKWQAIADLLAELIGVPAALIMRLVKSDIEVFVSSHSDGNPYHPGDHEHFFDSGLYCETVIKTNSKLLVQNALADEMWKHNPDIKLNMISYLGFPIMLPDGKPFGTICVLDNKPNPYSNTYEKLILNFRDIIQGHLELLYMNHMLGEKNKQLTDYLSEIQILRGVIPICVHCKKIRNDAGYWQAIERYMAHYTDAKFSHGICPDCRKEYYSDVTSTDTQNKQGY